MATEDAVWPYKNTIFERNTESHIATVTLNDPERLNPISSSGSDLMEGLVAAVEEVNHDPTIKVLIIKGAGRSFSSGADVDYVGHYYGSSWRTPNQGERATRPPLSRRLTHDVLGRRAMAALFDCLKLTIAQVHGYALGGGFDIAAACDLVIASDDAVFGDPYWRLVGPGGEQNMILYIMTLGLRKATELMFTTRWMSANEALECGFLNKVVPLERLDEEVMSFANGCALMSADGVVLGKAALGMVRNIWGARLGFHLGGIIHSLGLDVHFEEDEFNFMKQRRDLGYKEALQNLRTRYSDAFPEPERPKSMYRAT